MFYAYISISLNHQKIENRLNPILSDDDDAFGIVFNFAAGDVSYQNICEDCLDTSENSEDGQHVKKSIFTIEFHKKFGNIDVSAPNNVHDLFNRVGGQEMDIEAIRLVPDNPYNTYF